MSRLPWVGLLLLCACRETAPATPAPQTPPPRRAFYAWRTQLAPTELERATLQRHRVETVYLRVFDLGWDEGANAPRARGQLQAPTREPLARELEVTPVVYVENEVMRRLEPTAVAPLAMQLVSSVERALSPIRDDFTQLQIDCDWTAATRDTYFTFLSALQERLHERHRTLSVTIRLHQVKFRETTGVPPADRGMLMFYNLGDARQARTQPYLFSPELAQPYLARLGEYPMTLDLGLAVYGSVFLFRDSRLVDLLPLQAAVDEGWLPSDGGTRSGLVLSQPTTWKGVELRAGDEVRVERTTDESLDAALRLVRHARTWGTVALFSLDEAALSGLRVESIEHAFDLR